MPYAIVQSTLDGTTSDQLATAFATLDRFTKHDGQHAAKDAYGVLANALERDDADALQAALGEQGVETKVVDEADLPKLQTARRIKRATVTDNALVAYDGLGREEAVPWETVNSIVFRSRSEYSYFRPTGSAGVTWPSSKSLRSLPTPGTVLALFSLS